MTSDDLTTTQAAKLAEHVKPSLVFLGALIDRMNRRGFSPDDRLFRRALEAFDKVHYLGERDLEVVLPEL